MSQPLLDRPGRIATVCVLVAGIGLTVTGLTASLAHHQSGQAAAYVAVSVVLTAFAVLVWRRVRWATLLCLIALAGQVFAVAGTIWELTHSVAAVKATQLQAIGFNPYTGVTINLIYSATSFGVFCWIVAHRRTTQRNANDMHTRHPGPTANEAGH